MLRWKLQILIEAGLTVQNKQLQLADAVERARSHLPSGESLTHCEECGDEIPEARRQAIAGVRLCVGCQQALDEHRANSAGFNRRGSKDSQLR